jgi:hypothetical protein
MSPLRSARPTPSVCTFALPCVSIFLIYVHVCTWVGCIAVTLLACSHIKDVDEFVHDVSTKLCVLAACCHQPG